jgi:hypothetical protein
VHADVFAHVRPARVSVSAFSRRWDLHLDSAYQWLGAVGWDLDTLAGVFPGSIGDDDVDAMYHLAMSDPDVERMSLNAARVAVGRGSGRDRWWSVNLTRKALGGWAYINGKLLLSGVSARELLLPDWLDACYMLLWSGCDEQGQIKLDLELSLPPAGVAIRRSKAEKEKMLAAFAAD